MYIYQRARLRRTCWTRSELCGPCNSNLNSTTYTHTHIVQLFNLYLFSQANSIFILCSGFYLFVQIVWQKYRPKIPADCPLSFAKLMQDCWDEDPNVRPSFEKILIRLDEIIIEQVIANFCFCSGVKHLFILFLFRPFVIQKVVSSGQTIFQTKYLIFRLMDDSIPNSVSSLNKSIFCAV